MTAAALIPNIVLVSLLVWAVYKSMQPEMIFEKLGSYLEHVMKDLLGEKWADYLGKPIYSCVICMSFWHGLYIYWIVIGISWDNCLITCIGAVGFNALMSTIIESFNE